MKITTVDNVIERSYDASSEENFTIELTAKAIEVLSSQIYKDALLAIVRELGTNAADSHIEAGKRDIPFDVKLPSPLMPEFVIRDYGVGMSHEKVMTMYRTYFGSDKTNSNELTGCLGLGSKSPLAYTDQFSVTSWYKGEKSVYTVFKNEKGLPAIVRLDNEPSDEPTGIEIRISIKHNDWNLFKFKAKDVYKWFSPRPNVAGIADGEWPEDEIEFKTGRWALRADTTQKMTVVMGNVACHVEKKDLNQIFDKLSNTEKALLNCGPILYVGIGDVDITASRETLKFDGSKTLPAIHSLLKIMGEELIKKMQDDIDACRTHWKARVRFNTLKNTAPLGSILTATAIWRGHEVDREILLQKWNGKNLIKWFARAKIHSYGINVKSKKTVSIKSVDRIIASERAHVFIIDSKNHISRINNFVRTHDKIAYVVSAVDKNEHQGDAEIYTLTNFLKEFHLDGDVEKTSDLPDAPKNIYCTRNASYQVLSILSQRTLRSSNWEPKTIDFDSGGVYVAVKGNLWSAGPLLNQKASRLYDFLPIIPAKDIVGVRSRILKDFEASDKWQTLDVYIKEKYDKNEDAKMAAIKKAVYLRAINTYNQADQAEQLVKIEIKPSDSIFYRLCNILRKYAELAELPQSVEFNAALPFLTSLNIDSYNASIEKEYNEILSMYLLYENTYPLLREIRDWSSRLRKDVLQYVSLIDNIKDKPIIVHRHENKILCA